MYLLDSTRSLELVLGAAAVTLEPIWTAAWADVLPAPFALGTADGQTAGTSPLTAVPAPAGGTVRQLKGLSVQQADSAAVALSVRINSGGTARPLWSGTLDPGATLQYEDRTGFSVLSGTPGGGGGGGGGGTGGGSGLAWDFFWGAP